MVSVELRGRRHAVESLAVTPAADESLRETSGAVNGDAPLIAHVILKLGMGGLENGLVNLINTMPPGRYRHAIVCVKDATGFAGRLRVPGVTIVELHKKDGKDPASYRNMWRALRRLGPDIVHTRNANTLEYQIVAMLAGVRRRVHGEHGWDLHDLDGSSRKYRWLRRGIAPFVDGFITVSADLESYLVERVGIDSSRVLLIYNGVDTTRFARRDSRSALPFARDAIVVGTVGRLQAVKNQRLLARAFLRVLERRPELRERLRLAIIGDGPLAAGIRAELETGGAAELAWLPGERDDVAALYGALDVFVLPSLNEGISNTVLEAMASGLPVVATRVGGNPEIVADGATGLLVDVGDEQGMADAILRYVDDRALREAHGVAGRRAAETRFSLEAMVAHYRQVYDALLNEPAWPADRSA